jgi:hypothetical protein
MWFGEGDPCRYKGRPGVVLDTRDRKYYLIQLGFSGRPIKVGRKDPDLEYGWKGEEK